MGCRYCGDAIGSENADNWYHDKRGNDAYIYVGSDDGKFHIAVCSGFETCQVEINNCPWCGADLRSDDGNH